MLHISCIRKMKQTSIWTQDRIFWDENSKCWQTPWWPERKRAHVRSFVFFFGGGDSLKTPKAPYHLKLSIKNRVEMWQREEWKIATLIFFPFSIFFFNISLWLFIQLFYYPLVSIHFNSITLQYKKCRFFL